MRKKWIWCSLLLCMILLSGCRKKEEGMVTGPVIYYLNVEETGLVAEEYKIAGATVEDKVENILNEMQKETESIEYKSVFPETVFVEKWSVKDSVVNLHFNQAYTDMKTATEVLFRAAVVQTITQIEEINYVSFYIGDETLKDSDGNEIGYQNAANFVQNVGSSLHSYQEVQLKLYFSDGKGEKLIPEITTERYNSNMSIEKLIVEELIEGPEADECYATIPSGTKVLGVSVKDRICYVNFDENFLKQPAPVSPELTIYSLVNSIIEGGNSTQVQILVNGETSEKYQEKIDLSKPFSRNLDIIGEAQ